MSSKVQTAIGFLHPIRHLMEQEDVTEIMVNAPDDVWVKRYGRPHERCEVRFNEMQIRSAITMLASVSNRQVGDENAEPGKARIVSAGLPGFRFEAWTTPVAVRGPAFTCRKLASRVIPLEDYVARGAMPREVADLLRAAVRDRRNIFFAGATGSGKTTLCNAVLQLVPPTERLIVIETIPELRIPAPNHVALEADEEQGIGVARLLTSCLRGFPDRIIIGEVRGAEAAGLLKSANTGHPGSIGTLHANSSLDALERLEDMVLEGRPELPLEAIRRRIANTRPLIAYLGQAVRDGRSQPTLLEVREVTGHADGEYRSTLAYQRDGRSAP